MSENEFSVYWWDPEGGYYKERDHVSSEEAVKFAIEFSRRPAAIIGMVAKIMITDGGDHAVFVWEYGKGITFPIQERKP